MNHQRLAERLAPYLEALYPDRSSLSVSSIDEIETGWETELYILELGGLRKGEEVREQVVLRVYQGEGAGRKSVKEYHLMRKLGEVGYPVPDVYGHEESGEVIGKPFLLMERIRGTTLGAAYHGGTAGETRMGLNRLMRLLVRLHGLDVAHFRGLPGLRGEGDHIRDALSWYWGEAQGGLPWLKPVVDWLETREPCVGRVPASLVHMDYHGMNVLLREDGSEAVIDWGASRIGDPRMDLGWTLLLYTTFGGQMYRDPLLSLYGEYGGGDIVDVEYFEVMAATRRIIDFAASMRDGVDSVGLKPEVVEMMKASKGHYEAVHELLTARTDIRLKEFAETLSSL